MMESANQPESFILFAKVSSVSAKSQQVLDAASRLGEATGDEPWNQLRTTYANLRAARKASGLCCPP
jgi:hypothetical protein